MEELPKPSEEKELPAPPKEKELPPPPHEDALPAPDEKLLEPPKKKKLNWKLFFIAVFVVVLLDFGAFSLLKSDFQQNPANPAPKVAQPASSSTIAPTQISPTQFTGQSLPQLSSTPEETTFCTMEAKQCPDGSWVGRTGPKCEFAACPAKNESKEIMCGGFAGIACPTGYQCKLDGNYPDAGGKCIKN